MKKFLSIFMVVLLLLTTVAIVPTSAATKVKSVTSSLSGSRIANKAVDYTKGHYNTTLSAGPTTKPKDTKWYKKDKGLQNYQKDHDKFLKNDPYYASCDRLVCTAVRASGVDSKFPAGAVGTQIRYMNSQTKKWKRVKSGNLQPGDICVTSNGGHIFIYAGRQAIKSYYSTNTAKKGCDFVAASYGDYFPKTVKYNSTKVNYFYAVYRAK